MAGVTGVVPQASIPVDWEGSDGYLILDDATDGLLDTDQLAPTSFTTQTVSALASMNINRGRQNQFDQMAVGQCTISFLKTATLTADTPKVGQPMTVTAEATGSKTVFKGVITSAREVTVGKVTSVVIAAADRGRTANNERFPLELPAANAGPRIDTALAGLAGNDDFASAIDASTVALAAAPAGSILQACTDAALADGGVFYVAKGGTFTFLQATTIRAASRYTTPVVSLTAASGDYPARAIDPVNSVDQVRNQCTITTANGTIVSRENGASVTEHGRRDYPISTLNTSDSYAATLAQRYADVGALQDDQWASVSFNANRGLWKDVVGDLELYSYVELTSPETVDTVVEGISHTWTPQAGWETTLTLNAAVPAVAV